MRVSAHTHTTTSALLVVRSRAPCAMQDFRLAKSDRRKYSRRVTVPAARLRLMTGAFAGTFTPPPPRDDGSPHPPPPTAANRQSPPTMVEHTSYTRSFCKTAVSEQFFFSS